MASPISYQIHLNSKESLSVKLISEDFATIHKAKAAKQNIQVVFYSLTLEHDVSYSCKLKIRDKNYWSIIPTSEPPQLSELQSNSMTLSIGNTPELEFKVGKEWKKKITHFNSILNNTVLFFIHCHCGCLEYTFKNALPYINKEMVDLQDNEGATALIHACSQDQPKVIKLLRSLSPDLSLATKSDKNALEFCCLLKGTECLEALISYPDALG